MAVYQGARPRPGTALSAILRPLVGPLGWPVGRPVVRPESGPRAGAPAAPRTRHGRRTTRARLGVFPANPPRVGMILATIVVVFSGAFLWLTQSVRVSATNYDIVRLISDRDRLDALRVDVRSDLERLSGEPAIRQEALDRGLGQLGAPIVIPAR
jgi:hypothetical protein